MIKDIPIFLPDGGKYAEEALKGINLRFLNSSNKEQSRIIKSMVYGEKNEIGE